MSRPTIEETMLEIALTLAKRGTCTKKKVGCVLTDAEGHIVATGYNGQVRGTQHCTSLTPCPAYLDANLSCKAIHAETNALIRANGRAKIAYVTEMPCEKCHMLLLNAGIEKIVVCHEDIDEGVTL